jgi:hypothetical protein
LSACNICVLVWFQKQTPHISISSYLPELIKRNNLTIRRTCHFCSGSVSGARPQRRRKIDEIDLLLSQGSLSIFWSNWLVGGIVSLALFMVAWPVISWALEHAKLKREHEVVELD